MIATPKDRWLFGTLFLLTGFFVGSLCAQSGVISRISVAFEHKTPRELLREPIIIEGSKKVVQYTKNLAPKAIKKNGVLAVTYDLDGACLLGGPASYITLISNDNTPYNVSLSNYGENCVYGTQTAYIPLEDFKISDTLDTITSLRVHFWYPTTYKVVIDSIEVYDHTLASFGRNDEFLAKALISKKTPRKTSRIKPAQQIANTITSTPQPVVPQNTQNAPSLVSTATQNITPTSSTPTTPSTPVATTSSPTPPTVSTQWSIRSVSSMKLTKDTICDQVSQEFITEWVDRAVELGANYVAVETPYDDPECGSSVAYTKMWIDAIRARGLNVWHRHMPLAFEGIYDTPKDDSGDYLTLIQNYIKTNPSFFRAGDIFTPIPEPQNGGIAGVTYCYQGICVFDGAGSFNAWLRDAITVSHSAFSEIGLNNMKIGYYGFDGFVAWGDNNPDWEGILEDETIAMMGNITIDHYPEIVGDTMANDLDELQGRYPGVPIIIGEWGTITGGDTVASINNSMKASQRPGVIGFNYWHLGLGGNEALLNDDMTPNVGFGAVQSFFKK